MNEAVLEISYVGRSPEIKQLGTGTWLIGRESGDLVFNDPLVSGRHGQLQLDQGVLTYMDLGSTNGSFLGKSAQRLSGPVSLKVGDTLHVGDSLITVKSLVPQNVGGTMSAGVQPDRAIAQAAAEAPAPLAQMAPAARSGAGPTPAAPSMEAVTSDEEECYSRPTSAVRHNYPLAIQDAEFGTAMRLFMRTMPYALVRFGILVGISIVSIIWAIITFGGAAFLGSKVTFLGWIWALIGIGVFGGFWRLVVRYFLYLIKAGHIAVLTELITTNQISHGYKGMFEYGVATVKGRFGQVNALFALDLLIEGIVRAFNRSLDWIASFIPIPGLSSVVAIVNRIIYAATTYIDETIFSYNLARGDQNVWRSSKDAVIYYAQNSQEILKTGIWIVIIDYALTAVAWVVMLAPAFIITLILPNSLQGWGGLFAFGAAVLFASNFRGAFLAPLFLTMIMIKFHLSVRDQPIDELWDGRLSDLSGKFRELKEKAFGAEPSSAPVTS